MRWREAGCIFLHRPSHRTDHSESEDRFLLLGLSASMRLVVVSHTYRAEETVIRVISARKATKQEQRHYATYLR